MLFEEKTTPTMVTLGLSLLNENITRLVSKTLIPSNCTNTKSSTESKIILVIIKIVGVVGAALVFANIFLWVYEHRERKKGNYN